MCALSSTLAHPSTSLAVSANNSLYEKHQMDLSPTSENTEFERINHRKQLVNYNALFGRNDCS